MATSVSESTLLYNLYAPRRKIRLIEVNGKCRHLKKLTYIYNFFLNTRLLGMQSVWYQNENKCQYQNHSCTGIWRPQSGTGMLRYQTEMTDAGMLMPAVLALMLLPSYAYIHVFFNNLCKRLKQI